MCAPPVAFKNNWVRHFYCVIRWARGNWARATLVVVVPGQIMAACIVNDVLRVRHHSTAMGNRNNNHNHNNFQTYGRPSRAEPSEERESVRQLFSEQKVQL